MADVFDNAAKKGGERRHLAGAEEGEGVALDCRRPVGGIGIERMEEMILDPIQRRRRGKKRG